MSYKAVFFDLDGTILDTIEDLHVATNFALEKNNLNNVSIEKVKASLGNGIHKLIERVVEDNNKVEQVYKDMLEYYLDHVNVHSKPYEGIIELLVKLKKYGIPTAIISNKVNTAVQQLNDTYFYNLIDMPVGTNEIFKPKPDTRATNFCMKMLGLEAKDILYVGDTEVDIELAKNANLDLVLVTWGFRTKEQLEKIDSNLKFINKPEEILDYIK